MSPTTFAFLFLPLPRTYVPSTALRAGSGLIYVAPPELEWNAGRLSEARRWLVWGGSTGQESPRGWFGVLLESARIQSPSPSRDVASWRKCSAHGVDSRSSRGVVKSAASFVRNFPTQAKGRLEWATVRRPVVGTRDGMPPAGRVAFFALTQDLRPGLNCVAPPELGLRRGGHPSDRLGAGFVWQF
jgi:hypothetical protein